jgi:hypothetical protein
LTTLTLTALGLAAIWLSIGRASMSSEKLTPMLDEQQTRGRQVPEMISNAKSSGAGFERRELFQSGARSIAGDAQLSRVLTNGTTLDLDRAAVRRVMTENVEFLSLPLPDGRGGMVELDLMKVNIFAPGFSVQTSAPTSEPIEESLGLHYRGIVRDDDRSVAAISIFNNEVMGFYSTETDGNNVVGRLGGNNETDKHIVYAERDMKDRSPFHCDTKYDATVSVPQSILQEPEMVQVNCARIYVEANYDVYLNKGSSVPRVNSFIAGLFNQATTLFNNDGVSVALSEIFVWNSPSPYTGTTTLQQIQLFEATRPIFNGDAAHLVTVQDIGGIARTDTLCAMPRGHAVSATEPNYENVPTYSEAVLVFTHETGHNLGSPHTHDSPGTFPTSRRLILADQWLAILPRMARVVPARRFRRLARL